MCLNCEKCFAWNISFDSYEQTYEVDKIFILRMRKRRLRELQRQLVSGRADVIPKLHCPPVLGTHLFLPCSLVAIFRTLIQ